MIELFPSREIILEIGAVSLRWYGFMYFLGFFLGIIAMEKLQKYRGLHLTRRDFDALLLWLVIAVIAGGRLGYVLFWNPAYYLGNPGEIFAVWHGGMSSHGGMLATLLAGIWFCRRRGISFWALADVAVVPMAFALGLGRIGNFINLELYGTVTDLPWGMEFPGADGLRHPTQIYALLKDWFICVVLYMHLRATAAAGATGRTLGWFMVLYGVLRFVVEIFREQPMGYYDIAGLMLSHGQLLTLPLIILGMVMLLLRRKKPQLLASGS